MATYEIPFPDGSSKTDVPGGFTYAVIAQEGPGASWAAWDVYPTRLDAADEAAYLRGCPRWHAVEVVPVTAA